MDNCFDPVNLNHTILQELQHGHLERPQKLMLLPVNYFNLLSTAIRYRPSTWEDFLIAPIQAWHWTLPSHWNLFCRFFLKCTLIILLLHRVWIHQCMLIGNRACESSMLKHSVPTSIVHMTNDTTSSWPILILPYLYNAYCTPQYIPVVANPIQHRPPEAYHLWFYISIHWLEEFEVKRMESYSMSTYATFHQKIT